jgi:ketosteroid isomerase-like protein
MSSELLDRARSGLAAWQRGDVEALEPWLDPDVELTWWEPGDWDCYGRDAVMALLRERASQGATGSDFELIDAGDDAIVVSRLTTVHDGPQAGTRPATLVTFRNAKVITMRQFPDREQALEAAE